MLEFLRGLLWRRRVVEEPATVPVVEHRGRPRLEVKMMARLEMPGERGLTCIVSDVSRDGVRLTLPPTAVPQPRARLHLTFNGFQMSQPVRIVWSAGDSARVLAGARFEARPDCPLMASFDRFIRWNQDAPLSA